MDKHLKAEILSLRNEVLTNLQNVSQLVEAMDVRLKDDAEVSCLEKCPEIASLLHLCKSIKLHEDNDKEVVARFNNLVETIKEKMNIVQLDKFVDILAYAVKAAGVDKINEEKLLESLKSDQLMSSINEKEEDEIKSALSKIKERIDQISPKKSTTILDDGADSPATPVPEWATDVVAKDIKTIIKDAAAWDDVSQEYFVKMWNASRKHRIDILFEHLDLVINDINNFKYTGEYKIESLDDVKQIESIYTRVLQRKTEVINLINDRQKLEEIKNIESDDNFIMFYSWISNLFEKISNLFTFDPAITNDSERNVDYMLKNRTLSMIEDAIDRHEKEIYRVAHEWENVRLEPSNLAEVLLPVVDKNTVDSFIAVSYNNYTKDLKNAYMWNNSKKSTSASYTAII